MVTRSSLRFTIDVAGQPRTTFSASEKKDGTVIIRPKKDLMLRNAGQHPSNLRHRPIVITSQKHTIHPSSDSKDGVNTIHSTTSVENQRPIEWRHLTKAIKNEGGFAFLYVRRCSDLGQPHFVSDKPAAHVISLGSYDPTQFTLYYAIVASAPQIRFEFSNAISVGFVSPARMNYQNFRKAFFASIAPSHGFASPDQTCRETAVGRSFCLTSLPLITPAPRPDAPICKMVLGGLS